jgi:cyclase
MRKLCLLAAACGVVIFGVVGIRAHPLVQAVSTPPAQQSSAPPQTPAGPAFTLKPLGHNVYAAISNPGSGGNTGIIIGDDGVAVVDTFQTVAAAQQLLDQIRQLTPKPIKFVINTHYHLDHVTGNGVFAEAGATILAEHNVRAWIHSENPKFFGANITDEQKRMVAALVAPQLVYDEGVNLYLGSQQAEVRVFPGHTGGDSVVIVPEANVVFMGDLFWCHTLPNLIDASTEPLIASLATLTKQYPTATFVPGHGQLGTAQDVIEFSGYIAALRKTVSALVSDGKTGDALAEQAAAALKPRYGDWNAFERFVRRNANDTAAELRGQKKLPAPSRME